MPLKGNRLPGKNKVGHANGAKPVFITISKALQLMVERRTKRFRENLVAKRETEPSRHTFDLDEPSTRQNPVNKAIAMEDHRR